MISEETRLKMRLARLGKPNKAWIGKTHSKETIEKMKKSQKSAWEKNPNKNGFLGRKLSKELIEKWHNGESIKHRFKKGKRSNPKGEFKKGINPIHAFKKGNIPWWILQGKEHPMKNPEIRKKVSKSRKGQISWNKGIPMREESKKKLSADRKSVV